MEIFLSFLIDGVEFIFHKNLWQVVWFDEELILQSNPLHLRAPLRAKSSSSSIDHAEVMNFYRKLSMQHRIDITIGREIASI